MVPAKDLQSFQRQFLWNSPCSDNRTCFVQPGSSAFRYHGLKGNQLGGVQGHFQQLLPHLESLAPTSAPYSEAHRAFSQRQGVQAAPNGVDSSAQKRFLIFDQSGNDIRLFSRSFHFPSQNQAIMPNMPAGPQRLQDKKFKAGQPSLVKLIAETEVDENYSGSEGGDIREDTEEINCLLSFCTEHDDDDDDVDGENDELTSTGHSPFAATGGLEEDEKAWELTEEVASTDGSTKRQKLLNGGYKKSSLVDTASSPKLFRSSKYYDDDDGESSYDKGKDLDEDMHSILSTRQRQAKIWEKLRILESILPGVKRKDPILIIDEAISYLKSLRQKAEAMEVS